MEKRRKVDRKYSNTHRLIKKLVWKHIRKTGRSKDDFAELLGAANLYWVMAYASYDPSAAKFTTWLYIQIQCRLSNYERLEMNYRKKKTSPRDTSKDFFKPGWAIVDVLDGLSEETRSLLLLLKKELPTILQLIENCDQRKATRRLFKYLRQEQQWTIPEINTSFREMRELVLPGLEVIQRGDI